jgi:MinD-like ATPase involved in chromosome partitioning or flagellar assembly
MTMVMVASVKGAPGATTTALAMAATWPRPALLAELDPDGGDMRYRLDGDEGEPLDPEPGLLTFASVIMDGPDVRDHLQVLPGGLEVLVGLPSGDASEALDRRWAAVGALLEATPGRDVIADCGRLHPLSPLEELFPYADCLVLVTRPTVDGVAHLRARIEAMDDAPPVYVVVVTGSADARSARQVQAVLDHADLPTTVLGRIAYDPVAAGTLAGEWSDRLSRSWLMRSARDVSAQLLRGIDNPAAGSESEPA